MNPAPLPVGVLISGTGSNLKTLITAVKAGRLDLDFRTVISNRAGAPGLEHAREAGIPVSVITIQGSGSRARQEQEVAQCLQDSGAELIVLAGYMLILSADLVNRFPGRMINLHPSLLPKYPGLHTYEQVLASNDRHHGSSIHFVTAELDGGPVISQVRIPIESKESPASLAERLGPNEHRLLLATVELFSKRRVKMRSGGVLLDDLPLARPLLLNDENTFD